MSNRLLLIGAGGHCNSVLGSVIEFQEYDGIAIVDNNIAVKEVMGVQVIGTDDDLERLYNEGYKNAFITIGNINLRNKLYSKLKAIGFSIPIIVDKSAIVSKYTKINEGTFIGKGCILNVNSVIGECTIVNTGAIVEHDCVIGEFTNIAPGVVMGGAVNVGSYSDVGLNTTIKQSLTIGNNTTIGMGSVVTKNIPNNILAYGSPCRKVSDK